MQNLSDAQAFTCQGKQHRAGLACRKTPSCRSWYWLETACTNLYTTWLRSRRCKHLAWPRRSIIVMDRLLLGQGEPHNLQGGAKIDPDQNLFEAESSHK